MISLKLIGRVVVDLNLGLNVLVQHSIPYPISVMWSR